MYVYILANHNRKVLYIGVTNNLNRRYFEHRRKTNPDSFTSRYNANELIYSEHYDQPKIAIAREKQLKGWSHIKKLRLARSANPDLVDLMRYLPE